jgi:hypothetical protein
MQQGEFSMYRDLFAGFLDSNDTLRIYENSSLIFFSVKDRLVPLMDYLESNAIPGQKVTIFDKIMGNGAALLAVKANCGEVFSPLGSDLAIKTMEKYGIKYHLSTVVPYIQKPTMEDMCPMEKLSIGKEPEEFYQAMKALISRSPVSKNNC